MDKSKVTWISPQVKRILDRSSKDFSKVIVLDDQDDDLLAPEDA